MDRDQSAEDRFDAGLGKAGLANHSLEIGHFGEAADRFDEVAVTVLVLGDELADFGDEAVAIFFVKLAEAGPFGGREFEAEEAAAEAQDAVGFAQRGGSFPRG